MQCPAPFCPARSYASCQRRSLAATASQSGRTKGNADVLDQSALYSAARFAQAGREESMEKNGETYERSGDAVRRP